VHRQATLLFIACLLGCSSHRTDTSRPTHNAGARDTLVRGDPLFNALWKTEEHFEIANGTTRVEVTRHFGTPQRDTGWAVQDSAWPGIDSAIRLTFHDYEIGFLITKDRRDLLAELTLLTFTDTLAGGIRLGMSTADLLNTLHRVPTVRQRKDTSVVIVDDLSAPDEALVEFAIVAGTLRRVRFRPWID
jgi:hypothetical protein